MWWSALPINLPKWLNMWISEKKKQTPLPYSLSALQIDAAKRFGMSAQSVLDTCQRLYETHRLITYPRSDCRYLPEEHFAERHKVMNAISQHCQAYQTLPSVVDSEQRNRCWNDKKVEAHHAIIPTANTRSINLSIDEQRIYELMRVSIIAILSRCGIS